MNSRSLAFRLVAGYAALLSVVFALVGAAIYVGLQHYLQSTLEDTLNRRTKQIEDMFLSSTDWTDEVKLAKEIRNRIAPEINNRFVRVTKPDGAILYLSGVPADRSFLPANLAAPSSATTHHSYEAQAGLARLLIDARPLPTPAGNYLIEVGASLDPVETAEDHLLLLLVLMLPVLVTVAVSGGYFLVERALTPVDQIARTAERITHHNLNERLPIQRTGDELERLSISVNHMIARLDEAFQNSRRFLADASHELRTPLTVIRGELEEVANRRTVSDHESRERIGSVLEEVQRLSHIVEGLLALSRLDAGEAQHEWVRFDLAALAASTADQMKLLAEDEGIAVACNTDAAVMVEGDRSRLKQVVVNLLDNAIKYSASGQRIHLSVFRQADHAVLEVLDTGMGIPPESLPYVFERFYRVDKSRSRSRGGAGLGLSIVKSICSAHGADVEVQSTVGAGSCFRVRLRLARDQTPALKPPDSNETIHHSSAA